MSSTHSKLTFLPSTGNGYESDPEKAELVFNRWAAATRRRRGQKRSPTEYPTPTTTPKQKHVKQLKNVKGESVSPSSAVSTPLKFQVSVGTAASQKSNEYVIEDWDLDATDLKAFARTVPDNGRCREACGVASSSTDAASIPATSNWLKPQFALVKDLVASVQITYILGRVVMLNGIKTMDRHGQQTFLQTFWVKDNTGMVVVKCYSDSRAGAEQYASITIDSIVKVQASELHLARTSGPRLSSVEFHISTRDVFAIFDGVTLDASSNSPNKAFKAPLGISEAGVLELVPLTDLKEGSPFGSKVMVVITEPFTIASSESAYRIPTIITVSDGNTESELCLWSEHVGCAKTWVAMQTVLLITNPRLSTYRGKKQLAVGFATYIEVDVECDQAEVLRAVATAAYALLVESQSSVSDDIPDAHEILSCIKDNASASLYAPTTIDDMKRTSAVMNYGDVRQFIITGLLIKATLVYADTLGQIDPQAEDVEERGFCCKVDVVDEAGTLHSPAVDEVVARFLISHKEQILFENVRAYVEVYWHAEDEDEPRIRVVGVEGPLQTI